MEVNLYLGVASGEVDALAEEHGCVAVAVEGERVGVHLFGSLELAAFLNEPLEDGQHLVAVAQDVGLWMPLYAKNGLELAAFDGFDDSVGACGCDFQSLGNVFAGLVMEGIDRKLFAKEFFQDGVWTDADGVRGVFSVKVLAVLDACAFHLDVDVLIECSS